jgi:nucleoside-diphosphate-sugar epimerase
MKIFIAGATGVLGRRLIAQFNVRGHAVAGLARNTKNEEIVRSLGGEPRAGDLFDAESLARAAEGAEAIIHAATAIPTKQKTTPEDWAMNDRIRREGTRALAEAATRVGAKIFVAQSIVWVANPPNGLFFDETAPIHANPIMQSAADLEAIAREGGEKHGYRVAILRGGWFYDAESAHMRMMGKAIAKRRLPIFGDAVWSLVHTDDAASAFVAAAEAGRNGLWHVVDDEPVAMRDFLTEAAALLGASKPRQVPVWLARLIAGSYAVEFFTRTTRTSNRRIREELGWSPRYPTYCEGLRQIVAAWKGEGFPAMK